MTSPSGLVIDLMPPSEDKILDENIPFGAPSSGSSLVFD